MIDTAVNYTEQKSDIDTSELEICNDRSNVRVIQKSGSELKSLTENIVSLYDSGISTVGQIMNDLYSIMNSTEHEDGEIKEKLKEALARKLNLRKKDFEKIFSDLFIDTSDIQKAEIKKRIEGLIEEHRDSVALLKQQISDNKKLRLDEFKKLFSKIQKRQHERETEVKNMISDFQKQHNDMVKSLKKFLEEDKNMRVKDLKRMMTNFRRDREKRLEENKQRVRQWRTKVESSK